MVQIPNLQRIANCLEPIKQPCYKAAIAISSEAIKIYAVKIFLQMIGKVALLNKHPKVTDREIYSTTIFAPLAEEILFRGILQQGIHLVQMGLNPIENQELSDEDIKSQQLFRVHVSAIIFAAVHLLNHHESLAGYFIQFTWTYIGGVTFGYLSEKYESLSVSILVHGINNCLSVAGRVYPLEQTPYLLLAIFVNKKISYFFAVNNVVETFELGWQETLSFYTDPAGYIHCGLKSHMQFYQELPGRCYSGLSETALYCINLPVRCYTHIAWNRP